MKFTGTLIAVKDIGASKRFYNDVLGLNVVADFGANVTLEGGVVLQTLETWQQFIRTDDVVFQNNAGELYFEEDNLDAFCGHLKSFDVCYIRGLHEHPWGQRVIRFYDLDKHIIEVAEKLETVIFCFMQQGLSAEETAARMNIPVDFVKSCLNK